jgi:hypothetical protein
MKRCPNCNRTYTNDAQKFCTKDGTSLVAVSANLAQGETVRLDSADLGTTQFDPEATRVISRETPSQPTGDFDPFKTIMAKPPPDTTSDLSVTTGDLMPASMPPQPSPWSTGSSGPIEPPPPPSAPLPPRPSSAPLPPQSSSAPLSPPPQGSGPINAPSQPLQNSSGELGQLTMASFSPPPLAPSRPLPTNAAVATATAPVPAHAAVAKKKSKLPLVLGILAVLFVLGLGGVGAAYWFVIRPMLENRGEVRNDNTEPSRQSTPSVANTPNETTPPGTETAKEVPPYSPPADAAQFVNSKDRLDGKLAEHYVDFSFYYPDRWQKDPTAGVHGATNFAKLQRQLAADAPQEIFAVGWYESTGATDTDQLSFPRLAEQRNSVLSKEYPEYRKLSEGPTKVGPYDAYEFRFSAMYRNTDRGDIRIWGRNVFVPPVDGSKRGVTLLLLASSLASELKGVEDVGVKGELPMMLDSFRFGK